MATNPSTPGGNNPSGGGGTGNAPKPRATIVMKKGDAPGSGAAAPVGSPTSQRVPVSRPMPTNPAAQSARQRAVPQVTDREALGLSAARPSEMVAGLEEAAKRAEAVAARDAAKRKSGGKMSANVALHVDDTGRKWSLWVRLGIAAIIVIAMAAGGLMFYKATSIQIKPAVAAAQTRDMISDLATAASKMTPFKAGESITAQAAQTRLKETIQSQLDGVNAALDRDKKNGRNPDRALMTKREFLTKILTFKDGWGKPLVFTVDGDYLLIKASEKHEGVPDEPAKVLVRGVPEEKPAEPAPEKTEK